MAEKPTIPLVCIVDDDASVRDSLAVLLEAHGYEVLSLGSGNELLANECPEIACLIVDLHMPGMGGLDAIQALKQQGTAVPTILVTGRIDATSIARAGLLGVTQILEKPFSTARLVELVHVSVDGAR